MVFIKPLNLENLLLTTLAGNVEVFMFLALILISALAARFRMPNMVFGIVLVVFGVIISNYIGGLYLIMILVSGFLIFGAISNLFR